jgi:peroxiredoxin
MKLLSPLLAVIPLLLVAQAATLSPEAQRIEKKWQTTWDLWSLETRVATTPEALAKVWSTRPDITPFARQMWDLISPALNDEESLEPAAWFLRVAPALITTQADGSTSPTFAKEIDAIRKAVESHHMKSLKLIPMCLALATTQDPRSLAVLEKIQSQHPDPKTQGVAALGAAIILKSLGDNPDLMRKRLTCLRMAIIQSSDVTVDGSTVAQLAEDELYIIRYLSKDRVAPDLSGIDSAGRPLKLSDHQNKIIVLLFWRSTMQDAERVLQITTRMAQKFQGKPFIMIGVNSDPLEKLRALEAANQTTWPNLSDPSNTLAAQYRIGSWPLIYVLDGKRKIHYSGAQGSFAELTAEALIAEIKPSAREEEPGPPKANP